MPFAAGRPAACDQRAVQDVRARLRRDAGDALGAALLHRLVERTRQDRKL